MKRKRKKKHPCHHFFNRGNRLTGVPRHLRDRARKNRKGVFFKREKERTPCSRFLGREGGKFGLSQEVWTCLSPRDQRKKAGKNITAIKEKKDDEGKFPCPEKRKRNAASRS